MVTCPWCGTSYPVFQSNCKNCGGVLPPAAESAAAAASPEELPTPPAPPRTIADSYIWRLLSADGGAITALILGFIGIIFTLLGAGLTLGVVTAFVGIPFWLIGVVMLGIGLWLFIPRYQDTQMVVRVLREGEATRGEVIDLQEDTSVSINDRHPWIIRYQFSVNGQSQEGKVTTLNPPGQPLQVGKAVCVLYLPAAPQWSSIYPHP
jgi:hypothetical protein